MVEEQHTKTKKDLKVGIANRGVLHYFGEETVSLEDWFKEVSSSNIFDYVDNDGWPHYKLIEKLPNLKPGEQTILMKEAIVNYFLKINYIN